MALLEYYTRMKYIYIDIYKSPKIAFNYNIFTMPGILVFVDGKESIREARHISIGDLDNRINRYYNLMFNQ